jgi:hypothetical protein
MMAAGCGPAYLPLLYFYELVYLLAIEISSQTLERPAKLCRHFLISSQSFVTARPD